MGRVRSPQTPRVIALLVALCLVSFPTYAQYSGGSGTAEDPYQIATAADLIALGETPEEYDKHFILTADIDLDPNLPRGRVFDRAVIAPDVNDTLAGFQGKEFVGCLDGRGHVIRNLHVEASDRDYVGLVGSVAEEGRITHVGLEQVVVQGRAEVGGMVGENHGMVTCSYFLGDVVGHEKVGGMVGRNSGHVADCYGVPLVHGTDDVGGLVGDHEAGLIANCYAAAVSDQAGGPDLALVGSRQGRLSHCYYLGNSAAQATSVYRGTALSDDGMRHRSSFRGWDSYPDSGDGCADHWYFVEGEYPVLSWQSEITGLTLIPQVVGLTSDEAERVIEEAGMIVWSVYNDYHQERAFGEIVSTYPRYYARADDIIDLHVSLGPYDWSANAGDGSESNPYRIQSLGQLESLREHDELRDRHFVLTASIELNREAYTEPIIPWALTGVFDGQGHTLRRFSGMNTCLFDSLEAQAVVSDLTFTYVSVAQSSGILANSNGGCIEFCNVSRGGLVAGEGTIGGLVGTNTGTLSRCESRISVVGTGLVQGLGGMVGANSGTVVQCRVEDGTIAGVDTVQGQGGLVGRNSGQVTECFIQGAEIRGKFGTTGMGGLVGSNRGIVADCWSHTVLADSGGARKVGGLVGENFDTVRNCHADCWMISCNSATQVGEMIGASSGTITSCYYAARWFNNGLGRAISGDQWHRSATFVGWDFETIWKICEGQFLPFHRWVGWDICPDT